MVGWLPVTIETSPRSCAGRRSRELREPRGKQEVEVAGPSGRKQERAEAGRGELWRHAARREAAEPYAGEKGYSWAKDGNRLSARI